MKKIHAAVALVLALSGCASVPMGDAGPVRAAHILDDVPATFTVIGEQAKVVSGHRFEATRIRIEGYASRTWLVGGQSSWNGAYSSGEALVDNATGLVLEIEVTCRHRSYPIRRELVRVSV